MILYTKGKYNVPFEIDDEDYEKVSKYKWRYTKTGTHKRKKWYITSVNDNLGFVYLHRLIMNAQEGTTIDHKDGNPTNNKKENLRFCTRSQNVFNSIKSSNNKSGYKGVCYRASRNNWRAYISIDKKQKELGQFDTKEEAYKAYCDAGRKVYGEFFRGE